MAYPLPRSPIDLSSLSEMIRGTRNTAGNSVTSLIPKQNRLGKQAPEALAEELQAEGAKQGATMMIVNEDDRSEIHHLTNRFFLSNLSMQFREKTQLVETFGASSVSFFDDSVKVYNLAGQAIDYPSNSSTPYESMQQSSLIQLYNQHMRGTRLVKNKQIAVIKVMNHLIYGYPMNLNSRYAASQDKIANFSMSWVVAKHTLAMPGLFNEEELARMYDPDNFNEISSDHIAYTRGVIDNFLEAYHNNFTINLGFSDFNGEGEGLVKINVVDELPVYETYGINALNSYLLQRSQGNRDILEDLQENIKDGVTSMIDYLENMPDAGVFSNSSGMVSMFTEESLEKAKNSVDQMFNKDEHLFNVISLLVNMKAMRNKLYMTKLFL